ncbi:hypothetical protein ACFRMN_10620 [Streptomyces sp. NPDC056835]|uniref:hypothetical protein n=1 Tax=Streptomyces sp. NPDC056835 TaxID=3345956 RepID=UPI003698A93F
MPCDDAMAPVQAGSPSPAENDTVDGAYRRIGLLGLALACPPVLVGVFVGAPLFAGDLESGTAKFVGLLVGGAAAGLPLRRTLPAMVVTFGVPLVLKTAWSFLRMSFASTVTKTTGGGLFTENDMPVIP